MYNLKVVIKSVINKYLTIFFLFSVVWEVLKAILRKMEKTESCFLPKLKKNSLERVQQKQIAQKDSIKQTSPKA